MKMLELNEGITFNTINWLHIHIQMYTDKCGEREREREREREERESGVAILCDFSHHTIIIIL